MECRRAGGGERESRIIAQTGANRCAICEGQRQAIEEHKEKREPVQDVLRRTVQACGSEMRVDNAMRHMMHSHVHVVTLHGGNERTGSDVGRKGAKCLDHIHTERRNA